VKQLFCNGCKELYDEDFFAKCTDNRSAQRCAYRRARCMGCEQEARDEEKQEDRFLVKARNALYSHARRLIERGVIQYKQELIDKYGWNIKWMAHQMEHAFGNCCDGCRRAYASFPNGLSALTLDIIDPKEPPYYCSNVWIRCETCNKTKGDRSATAWARRRANWEKWEKSAALRKANPWKGTLFEGIDS